MQTAEVFKAHARTKTTTGAARAVRNSGMVPAIVYGGKAEPQKISVDYKQLLKECQKAGFFSRIYNIELNKNVEQVIARDLQLHPVHDTPIHVDFQRVTKDSKINVHVPLYYINEDKATGIKLGGILNVVVHSLEVVCSPNSIPEKFEVDLTGMGMNHSIHLDSIKLPEGVKIAHPERDNTIATIVAGSSKDQEKTEEA
jgi:large subunit ribosomal protein L25